MLKLYLPEGRFHCQTTEHLRIAFHNAAMQRSTLVLGLTIPKIEVAIITLPKAALSVPFLFSAV